MRKIVLDTETTGLDPELGHRIIEIGAVELSKDLTKILNIFHCYLNPERDIPKESYNVHGLSREFLLDKPKFYEIVDKFLNFIKGAQLIIHNAVFDMKFLNYELFKIFKPAVPNTCIIDTLKIARKRFPKERVNLDALCYKYNIDTSGRNFHGALKDAKLLASVYSAMTKGMQAVFLDDYQKESNIIVSNDAVAVKNAKIMQASSSEIQKHKQLLSKIPKSLWIEGG